MALTPEWSHITARLYSKVTDLNLLFWSALTQCGSIWVSTKWQRAETERAGGLCMCVLLLPVYFCVCVRLLPLLNECLLMSCSVTVWVYSCEETLKSFCLHTKASCPSHILEYNERERERASRGFWNQNIMRKQTPTISNFVPVWYNLCRFY